MANQPTDDEPIFDMIEGPEDGKIPEPDRVTEDEGVKEICRIWLHSDSTISHITSPFALDGPTSWGAVLAEIATSLTQTTKNDGEKAKILVNLVHSFLHNLGYPVTVVAVPCSERVLDPSELN